MDTQAPAPPEGIFPGAVERDDGRVTFALYAPGKRNVSLIGDFNHWDRAADPMLSTPAGLWWIEKDFSPGRYEYQFAVEPGTEGGETVICDPYARALVDDSAYDPPR